MEIQEFQVDGSGLRLLLGVNQLSCMICKFLRICKIWHCFIQINRIKTSIVANPMNEKHKLMAQILKPVAENLGFILCYLKFG